MTSTVQPPTVFCQKCGASMTPQERFCRHCGWDAIEAVAAVPVNASDKSRVAAALLCFFVGVFGVHRFYAGKIGTGILWLCTLGFLGFGMIIDMILILCGEFKDAEGRKIVRW